MKKMMSSLNLAFVMEMNIDAHIRRMERASADELVVLSQQLEKYIGESGEQKETRSEALRQALARLRNRSDHELTLVNELIGASAVA